MSEKVAMTTFTFTRMYECTCLTLKNCSNHLLTLPPLNPPPILIAVSFALARLKIPVHTARKSISLKNVKICMKPSISFSASKYIEQKFLSYPYFVTKLNFVKSYECHQTCDLCHLFTKTFLKLSHFHQSLH